VLAGSVLTLDRAVRNIMQFAELPFDLAVRMATVNPARVVRQEKKVGVIAPGAAADLVALTPSGDVLRTFVGGTTN
jgi:N-acetylglucosamine-6-phosphate deacetylase